MKSPKLTPAEAAQIENALRGASPTTTTRDDPMTYTDTDIRATLSQAKVKEHELRTSNINLLLHLAALKEDTPNDAAMARQLIDCFDDSKRAYEWVRKAQRDIAFMFDVLALQIALEGKARAQRQAQAHQE